MSNSRLEDLLRAQQFVITTELAGSDASDPLSIRTRAGALRGYVDAINCTDNTSAHVHVSPLAVGRLLVEMGIEPIMQLTCRDRNRLALQADLLGAAVLGVRNLLLMMGDDPSKGDHPDAKPVYDLDSLHLMSTAKTMRDQGTYLSGRRLEAAPRYFIGAVEDPFGLPVESRPARLAAKVEAGAQFVQTQIVFRPRHFAEFMARVQDLGLLDSVFIIPSVNIPRSAKGLRYMKEHVSGVIVPDELVHRMERTPPDHQEDEGVRIALELIDGLRGIQGVSGIHLIAIKWEEGVIRVLEKGRLPTQLGAARAHPKGPAPSTK
jgi:methylenetetrahydrofolate reductase (NADPH)